MIKLRKYKRAISFYLLMSLFFEIVSPTVALALTQGTMQPEYETFEPADSSEMVDLFSGDFKYNIPLLDVDGYPINLNYHAGPSMDQEASWVGLGWNINSGSLNHFVKGFPDDFKGDMVLDETFVKSHTRTSSGKGWKIEGVLGIGVFGVGVSGNGSYSWGKSRVFDNYKGYGIEKTRDISGTFAVMSFFGGAGSSLGASKTISSLDGGTFSKTEGEFESLGIGTHQNVEGSGTINTVNTRTGDKTQTKYESYYHSLITSKDDIDFEPFGASPISPRTYSGATSLPNTSIGFQPKMTHNTIGFGIDNKSYYGEYGCIGFKIWFIDFTISFNAYRGTMNSTMVDATTDPVSNKKAYGYLNLQDADVNSLMDFNENTNSELYKETPRAPMGVSTYDMYSATAHGLGYNFRAHRNDIGLLYNNKANLSARTTGVGFEIGFGGWFHISRATSNGFQAGISGGWTNNANQSLDYKKTDINSNTDPLYEETYFKSVGDISKENSAYIQKIGDDTPIAHQLIRTGISYNAVNSFPGASAGLIYDNQRKSRENNIKYLNTEEASKFGVSKTIPIYDPLNFTFANNTEQFLPQTTVTRSSLASNINHHISEVTVTNTQGARYIYGIPVYNKLKKEIAFNISDKKIVSLPKNKNWKDGTVEYDSDDKSPLNKRGLENLYHTETTPAYVQSYLLTSLLSPNYVDLTDNGPTDDDFGDYVKFNYSKTDNYKWRAPYNDIKDNSGAKRAIYDKGLIGDEMDDHGFIMYGEKDLWYSHSIETKNHVVLFYTEANRKDCWGVLNEDGSINTNTSAAPRLLKKIELYSKHHFRYAQKNNTTPVPIKTVNFEYDYSLCKNVYNNKNYIDNNGSPETGKLTLKKIYFTYGSSKKGKLTPYAFYYGDVNHNEINDVSEAIYNPDYSPKMIDRWGDYKPCVISSITSVPTFYAGMNNDEYPYSEQNKILANQNSNAWNLTTIKTPTGAKMNIDYEADDYGYVQNEVAGQMIKIKSVLPTKSFALGTNNLALGKYLLVDLEGMGGIPVGAGISSADDILRKQILNNDENLYYKCFVKISGTSSIDEAWDFVPAYTKIDLNDCSVEPSQTYVEDGVTKYKYAYIKQRFVTLAEQNGNTNIMVPAVMKAGWQYCRLYIPRIAYPGSEPNNYTSSSYVAPSQGLSVAQQDLLFADMNGQNIRFYMTGMSQTINLDKSFAKVRNYHKNKKGGGHRVKRITTEDNWANSNSTESNSTYGLEYDYTTNENNEIISSGVASYEPLVGGDENALRRVQEFSIAHNFAPNNNYFVEFPVGEYYYPTALVGYSKVKIKNIKHYITSGPNTGSSVCGNGGTSYEFYTAKDFPIITKQTNLQKIYEPNEIINDLTLASFVSIRFHLSQGFTLKFNNMHGQLKGKYYYAENDFNTPISGQTYYYKCNSIGNGSYELDNKVNVLSPNETISEAVMGRNIDISNVVNYNNTTGHNMVIEEYTDVPACTAFTLDGFRFNFGTTVMEYGSVVNTKIENKQGILTKIVSFDNNTINTFENLAFDENTGEPLITKASNNNNESVYSYNYPAYWGYPRMGLASDNTGMKVRDLINTATGQINTSYISMVNPGDEVIVYGLINNSGNYQISNLLPDKFWVSANMKLIDAGGNSAVNIFSNNPYATYSNFLYTVVRSGKRNMPKNSMANVVTLQNPIITNGSGLSIDATQGVLNTSALEYSDNWNLFCGPEGGEKEGGNQCFVNSLGENNPYLSNVSGNWHANKIYSYKTQRNYNHTQNNIKYDGTYQTYLPFWKFQSAQNAWLPVYDNHRTDYNITKPYENWVQKAEVTVISPYGHVLETKDKINQYHSTIMGYNNTLMKGSATNSSQRDFGVESFEDYVLYKDLSTWIPCYNNHLGFYPYTNAMVIAQAHTGYFSLRMNNNLSEITLTRSASGKETCNGSVSCKCINGFSPVLNSGTSKKYVMSFWIKSDDKTLSDYLSLFNVAVTMGGTPIAFSGTPKKTQIINGWQKFDFEFNAPSTGGTVLPFEIKLGLTSNGLSRGSLYLDDFRIHPYNAIVSGYVYDPLDLRMFATLDDRNFATFYEYDNEGTLVRVKKETEKGIYTVSENRSSIKKK